jgi:hypothetical protein
MQRRAAHPLHLLHHLHGMPWWSMQELERLGEDANVFKLIGPALIKQDLVEAKSNVSKRLEYIKGEIERADTQIKSFESKSKQHEQEVGVSAGMLPCGMVV